MADFFLKILIIFGFCLILNWSTRILIDNLKILSIHLNIPKFAIANFLVALGTSLPELSVSIDSAIKKTSSLAIGNIIGSNIADLSIIIGLATLLAGSLRINRNILFNNIHFALAISTIPLILLIDGKLTRVEGIILILIYVLWQKFVFRGTSGTKSKIIKNLRPEEKVFRFSSKNVVLILGAIFLLVFATENIVKLSFNLAHGLQISPFLIGIFIVGIGTSLPELIFEMQSLRKNECEIALGDLMGSIVVNSSLIIGIAAIISPAQIFTSHLYFASVIFYVLIALLFYLFIRTEKALSRAEGSILIISYFLIIISEILLKKL